MATKMRLPKAKNNATGYRDQNWGYDAATEQMSPRVARVSSFTPYEFS
jgi:hypothetical protein